MPVPQGSPGDRLLEALGYRVRWESWVLELLEGAAVPDRELPAGYAVREADPSEYEQAWTVQEDAFLEWSVRDREPFEDWQAEVDPAPRLRAVEPPRRGRRRPVPWSRWRGCSWARSRRSSPGSRPSKDERGRGLAQALLVDAFAAGTAHGARKSELSTDSRTGALASTRRSAWSSRRPG